MVASHFSYETAYRPGLSFLFLLFSALRPLGLIVPHSSTTLSPVFLGTTPPHQYLLCQQSSGKGDVALPPQAAPQPITVPSVSWAVGLPFLWWLWMWLQLQACLSACVLSHTLSLCKAAPHTSQANKEMGMTAEVRGQW